MQGEMIPPAALGPPSTTILIVEDDTDIADFLQELIEEETPYHTYAVSNGFDALNKARQLHPSLLLLDYRLPGMNGIELYDRLQQMDDMGGVPAIMMSATLPVEELQRRGIFQLRKPMDNGGVIRMITHALATSEEQRLFQKTPYQLRMR